MDRISELPELAIHHILSFLKTKELAQSSFLSKKWLQFWSTRSILDFNRAYFRNQNSTIEEDTRRFCEFVDNTLRVHQEQRIKIQKFRLLIDVFDNKFDSLISKWLRIAVDNKVVELHLYANPDSPYFIPEAVFDANSLTALQVYGFVIFPYCRTKINWYNLTKLKLMGVHTNDWVIQRIVFSCPLLEKLVLFFLYGLERFRMANLCKLKLFEFATFEKIEEVIIDAPSLQSCTCMSTSSDFATSFTVVACDSLKYLKLHGLSITDVLFHKILSACPSLEELHLVCCKVLKWINIRSHSLKQFCLNSYEMLVEVKVTSPNLLSLMFGGHRLYQLSLTGDPRNGNPDIYVLYRKNIDALKFYELRAFLTKSYVPSLRLDFSVCYEISFTEEWGPFPHPRAPKVGILSLKTWISIPPSAYPALVNGLFWSCRPKYVLISWNRCNRDLIKFLFEELEESIDTNCCNSDQIKCWRHHLECWYPRNFCRRGNAWKFIPWKVLEDVALTPNDRHLTILQLTWGQLVRKSGDFKRQKLSDENAVNFI